ncbi:MAG: LysE family translocator, partial [Gammaproteobacteria bacterium]|nr:LysE family translocator [Gammaproteobacteria bacterium]
AVGCTLGIVPAALASILGLAAVLHTSALAFQLLKYIGVAYLFFMAWSILRDEQLLDQEENASDNTRYQGRVSIAVSGTLINVLNPKLSLFFLAFLPQFLTQETTNPTAQLLLLAAVFMLMTLLVFALYAYFAAQARKYVISKPAIMRWLKRSFAATFAFLGLRLALDRH